MSPTPNTDLLNMRINHKYVTHDVQMALKHATADDIAYFLWDHPETRAVVELLLEAEKAFDDLMAKKAISDSKQGE